MTAARWTVVGVDLSLTSTGICVATDRTITTHRLQSTGRKTDTLADRANRLQTLAERVLSYAPTPWTRLAERTLFVIEAPAFSRTTGSQHDRSGLWWSVVGSLHARGLHVAEVQPSGRAKYATGRGNAGKDEVLAAVVRRYPQVDVTGNDVADAVVLAAMGARALGQPIDNPPQTHLAAMAGVRWPDGLEVAS